MRYRNANSSQAEAQRRLEYQALVQQRDEMEELQKRVEKGDEELDRALVGLTDSMKRAEITIGKNQRSIGKRTKVWETLASELGVSSGQDTQSSSGSSM